MAQGRRPDVDSLAALLNWSGLKAEMFVESNQESQTVSEPLAQITAYLRADPHLTPEGAEALAAIVKAGYERLRKDSN